MPDYKTMYFKLFNAVTDAVNILCKAQQDAEEIYTNSYEDEEDRVKKIKVIKTKE